MNYPLDYLIGLPPMASVLIKITLILLLAWGLHFATRRSNPRWRVLLWRGVMIAIPLVFLLNPIAYLEIALAPQEQSLGSVQTSPPAAQRIPTAVNEHSIDSTTEDGESVLVSDAPSFSAFSLIKNNPFSALFLVWATISFILVGRMILGRIRIRKLIATSVEAPENVRLILERVCSELGCRKKIGLRTSPGLASPFLAGSSSPAIVIPDRMLEASQTPDLPAVFAHEVAHLRSADSFWVGLSGWMNALLWFHPLVWRISSAHQLACEKTCDGVAAAYVEDEKAYSAVLARVALVIHTPAPNVVCLPMARSSEVVKRLEALSRKLYSLPMRGRVLAVNGFLFAAAVLLLSGLRVVHSQDQKPEASADLLDFLIVQNETARQKIKSVAYKMDFDYRQATIDGPFTISGTREEKRDGDRMYLRRVESQNSPVPGAASEVDDRTIVNERITGEWSPRSGNVIVHENESPGSMSPGGASVVERESPLSALNFGFGDGEIHSLREARDLSDPSIWRFTVEEITDSNGDLLYRVVRTPIEGVEMALSNAWVVDPARGFLITRMTAYFNGEPWAEVRVEVGEVPGASDVWFPLEIEKTVHEGVLQGEPRGDPSFYFHGSVTEVEVNRTYADAEFELEALGHPKTSALNNPDGIHVLWSGPDGSITIMEYFRGRLMPTDTAREILRAEARILN